MKALSLHGPWAYYERKAAENECRIVDLEAEVRRWKIAHDDLQNRLAQAEADQKRLQEKQLPSLLSEKERAIGVIDSLQAELARLRLERTEEHNQLTAQVSTLTDELQKLSAENTVLRSELAKTVHQKQLTSSKLDQIRKKLGLTESEAKAFIQELDEARASSKVLREENKELAADNAHLKGQVESRSQHCMTLIGENKRLLEQVAELRLQLQRQQGELWAAKTEHHTAAAAVRQLQQTATAGARKQLVVRERPPQQQQGAEGAAGTTGGDGGGVATAPAVMGTAAKRGAGGSQNRPPWTDSASGKAGGAGAASTKTTHVPVGVASVVGTDAAKAGIVRQALAVRQQRLVSAQKQQP
ncbi:hypothetical protein Agub_g11690 [Astrephomene gubernaculifera]|uniref:Uncharacterized protein n=1 Tax=Astrephomene gubernaculifera TaxID=47775 RepID=A0AAD3HR69_9CHLO|nr:hypothetical protein Agub_g11690 [Astrephomene gubernaculifera]